MQLKETKSKYQYMFMNLNRDQGGVYRSYSFRDTEFPNCDTCKCYKMS